MSAVTIDQITLSGDPAPWEALGFTVTDRTIRLGQVTIGFAEQASGQGLLGWSLRGLAGTALDGLSTASSEDPPAAGDAPAHPNGVIAIDHVVAISPDLARTVTALQTAGLDLRRIRDEPTPAGAPRQAFFRLGQELLEVVQEPDVMIARSGGPVRPARFWGLALLASDIERTVAGLGPHVSPIRDAVQPGRRIATIAREAGLSLPVALMSPRQSNPRSARVEPG